MNSITVFWSLFIIFVVVLSAQISDAMKPFFISFIIAYLLYPTVNFVTTRLRVSHTSAVSIIFIIFFSLVVVLFVIVVPIIYQEITIFINNVPKYKSYFQTVVVLPIMKQIYSIEPDIALKIRNTLSTFINDMLSLLVGLTNSFWHYTMATINILMLFVLIPVISFYFLRDWHKIIDNMKSLLPIKTKKTILDIFSSINNLLSAYIRGQLNICILLSVYYSIFLTIIGVDLALLLGIMTGFLVIIPFIGTLISFSITLIIAYIAFGINIKLMYIAIVYVVGNICESYILSPKIIGNKIGLHPVWIIFAIFACGNLFGFAGIFFAIPLAGITKILLLNAVSLYKSSRFYR